MKFLLILNIESNLNNICQFSFFFLYTHIFLIFSFFADILDILFLMGFLTFISLVFILINEISRFGIMNLKDFYSLYILLFEKSESF